MRLAMRWSALCTIGIVILAFGPTTGALSAVPRSDTPVFTGPGYVLIAPPKTRCRLSLKTTLPAGTPARLEFVARGFIMPWDTVDHPDTWAWKPWGSVGVKGGRVDRIVKVTQDGYWRYWSSQGASEPRFIDVYPTSDLADPGVPGAARPCRGS